MNRFRYEKYEDSARELTERLAPFGITTKYSDEACVETRTGDGQTWREIGDVCAYDGGTRMVVWFCRDATDREMVVLLRTAERVLTHGCRETGWVMRTTATGRQYWATTVFVPVDDAEATAAAEAYQGGDESRDGWWIPLGLSFVGDARTSPPAHDVSPLAAAVAYSAEHGWHMVNVPPAWALDMLAALD